MEVLRYGCHVKKSVRRWQWQSLLDPNADSLTFYEKGAWALLILREQLGDQAFRQGIASYLKKYSFSNATVTDF
ncbi:M1 family aminopeptidase [Maribacter confluentis]|uniref:M1 family aminopeptidase n=1 Tax=Maribacter confluentis TaxID=1656093 RepID=UPI00345C01E3